MTTTTKTGFSDSWTKRTSKHCANTKHGSAFSTLTAAQDFCLQQGPSACSGVYDDGCDGKGSFYACKVGAFDSSSIGSCIYTAAKHGWLRAKYCALYCMNVDMPVHTVGHAHVRFADDRVWIWGTVGVAFTANAIEKLSEVTCVLTLSFHDDPKNDVDERYVWSDVTISMSRSRFVRACVRGRGDRVITT